MTAGVTKWSTEGRDVKRIEFKPFAAGDYDFILDTSAATVGKNEEKEGAVPYVKGVKVKIPEVQTATGSPRSVYWMAHLGLTPGSDGIVMPERANGLLGLARALGEEVDVSELNDDAGHRLSAKEVKQWLLDHDGATGRCHVKVQAASGGYPAKNEVAYWMDAGDAAEPEAEADESESEDEDEAPKKPAPKAAAKPAAKSAKKR